jgi:MFS family permease
MVGVGQCNGLAAIIAGRFIAGLGIGAISTGTILYMAEACHHRIRGGCLASFQCFIAVGYLAATIMVYLIDSEAQRPVYRIFIGIQLACPLISGTGLYVMPESPRYLADRGKYEEACRSFEDLRGLKIDTTNLQYEVSEVIMERQGPSPPAVSLYKWVVLWAKGYPDSSAGRWDEPSVPRWFVGILVQMMHEWTGISFILYFTNRIFESSESVIDPYLVLLILAVVNVCSTPISMWTVDYLAGDTF